jgi:hypothetical protein
MSDAPEFDEQMALAREIMAEDHDILRDLPDRSPPYVITGLQQTSEG